MHVLLILPWFGRPGAAFLGAYFKDQAHALQDRGHQVGILYPSQASLLDVFRQPLWGYRFRTVRSQTERGIPVLANLGYAVPKAYDLNQFSLRSQLKALALRYFEEHGQPDVLHAHSALLLGMPTAHVGAAYGLPFLITEHQSHVGLGSLTASQKANIKQAVAMAKVTTAVSLHLAERMRTISECDAVRVIPNMVDTDFFAPPTTMERADDNYSVLYVGSLIRSKRIDILLRAFEQCFRAHTNVHLYIGGTGPELRKLQQLACQLGIATRVEFLGELEREDVRHHMRKANIFVLPSSYETFGVVLIEALATGLPVISTLSGGQKDIVTEKFGKLVQPDNLDELVHALRDEYEARAKRQRERLDIAEDARARYSKNEVVTLLEQAYAEAITKTPSV